MRAQPFLVLVLAATAGCGPAISGRATTPSVHVPEHVTADQYEELVRRWTGLSLHDSTRAQLRERLVAYLDQRTAQVLQSGSYDALVEQFAAITAFYSPEDLEDGRLPAQLDRLAVRLRERGSPLGDEGRVLSALLALHILRDEDSFEEEYRVVADWGRDARGTLANPIDRYGRDIEVWEQHSDLTPTPEVLSLVARLYVERRDAILTLMRRDGRARVPRGMSLAHLRMAPLLVRRAAFDVAGVFLRRGDVASALSHVEAMGGDDPTQALLVRKLREARHGDADTLAELAHSYREGRPAVTRGLCSHGFRLHPRDPRFALCLARAAARATRYAAATGWYSEAIRIMPTERELYDEALVSLATFISRGLADANPAGARAMANMADGILQERQRRWPTSDPALPPERLQFVVGLLEMNAGNVDGARTRFEASTEARENADAALQLGRLHEDAGEPQQAARLYRRALDLTQGEGPEVIAQRAEVTQLLGDAFRSAGNPRQATRMYRQALELWDEVLASGPARGATEAQSWRGVLLDRLGRRDEATAAFRAAITGTPGGRGVFARILSYLVTSPLEAQLAGDVFGRAQRQMNLAPEWNVYFALWMKAIAGRAGGASDEDAAVVLRSHRSGQEWFSKLARFAVGELPYEELLGEASNVGERAEALFYEGTRLLASGHPNGARRQFQLVLDTHMVSFYEYTMARELLRTMPAPAEQTQAGR